MLKRESVRDDMDTECEGKEEGEIGIERERERERESVCVCGGGGGGEVDLNRDFKPRPGVNCAVAPCKIFLLSCEVESAWRLGFDGILSKNRPPICQRLADS